MSFPQEKFPETLTNDNFREISDVSDKNYNLVQGYQLLIANGNWAEAAQYFDEHKTDLEPLMINAELINWITDAVKRTQRYALSLKSQGIYLPDPPGEENRAFYYSQLPGSIWHESKQDWGDNEGEIVYGTDWMCISKDNYKKYVGAPIATDKVKGVLRVAPEGGLSLEDGVLKIKPAGDSTSPIYTDENGVPTKLGTVGDTTHPIWLNNGTLTKIDKVANAAVADKLGTANVGAVNRPIYLEGGVPKPITGPLGTEHMPIYIDSNGCFQKATDLHAGYSECAGYLVNSIADRTPRSTTKDKPIYFSNGIPVECSTVAANKLVSGSTDYSVGSATRPVYFKSGVPTACNEDIWVKKAGDDMTGRLSMYNGANINFVNKGGTGGTPGVLTWHPSNKASVGFENRIADIHTSDDGNMVIKQMYNPDQNNAAYKGMGSISLASTGNINLYTNAKITRDQSHFTLGTCTFGVRLSHDQKDNKDRIFFRPVATNTNDNGVIATAPLAYLGSGTLRWSTIYSNSNLSVKSDRNAKNTIKAISDKYENLFKRLSPDTFKYNDGDRVHVGFIAQDVETAMIASGLSATDFAALCKDEKVRYDEETGQDIAILDENGNPQYEYSLRYGEFVALNTHMIQKLMKRVDELEAEVAALKGGK